MQACVGFGYAAVALSLLPYFMDIRLGNLAVSFSSMGPMVVALWVYRSQLDWSALAWSLAGAGLLMPVGLWAFAYLPSDLLVRGAGLTILLIMVRQLFGDAERALAEARPLGCAGAGAISGFLAGAVGVGGRPIAAYAVRQPWPPERFKAVVLGFLLIESIVKAIGFAATGWVDREVVVYSSIAVPFAVIGGGWASPRPSGSIPAGSDGW